MKKLSKGLQVFIHMGIGLVTYISVGLYVGWIPLQNGGWAITGTIVIAGCNLVWILFCIIIDKRQNIINAKLKKKQGI